MRTLGGREALPGGPCAGCHPLAAGAVQAAGAEFTFDARVIGELALLVEAELERLGDGSTSG
jgi:hypothetical protein